MSAPKPEEIFRIWFQKLSFYHVDAETAMNVLESLFEQVVKAKDAEIEALREELRKRSEANA